MSDKFQPGDRVIGTHGWKGLIGTVIKRKDDHIYEAYEVRFDVDGYINFPHARWLRKLTKLEKAMK